MFRKRDRILAGLLCCEMVARRRKSLAVRLRELFVKVGSFYPQRENFRLTRGVKEKFTEKLEQNPRDFFGRKVKEVVRTDGLKLICQDGSWVSYRLSGTEPVVRVYSGAASKQELEKSSALAKQWIFE
jgi:phosphoglucomutase